MKKYATKIQGSIATRALIKTRNSIIVMEFPGLIQIQGLTSCKNRHFMLQYSVYCFVFLPSILYFTC